MVRDIAWRVLSLVAVFALSACATDADLALVTQPIKENWTFETKIDPSAAKESPSISLQTVPAKNNAQRSGFVSATVTCKDGAPVVMFVFEFPVGASHNSVVGYRFDQKPAH